MSNTEKMNKKLEENTGTQPKMTKKREAERAKQKLKIN